ncbi:hypothetical protein D051_4223 [Vibrio parahaemolyticus VPCR-2010]|nr:hypothetical protein VP10329_10181 [Vibrio parahaemolyticus 10329]EQM08220.1 hypothetical protein D045_0154 [Vibrio parahaemolyticus VP-NY4]EQM51500.1 hypothetical protein D051_4223 [Vibrio parahaemolyticus VPCR-2010]ESW43474.1 hypothetical protein D022_3127 [Vibrio parahaemolyticus 12310]ETT12928.1 hypothetical protein D026_0090 [Vibrio parahaemolyticus 605]EVT81538.1 hypothetical protein D032_0435 [Vibrio parahaemolyticus V14/01]
MHALDSRYPFDFRFEYWSLPIRKKFLFALEIYLFNIGAKKRIASEEKR